MISFVIIMAAQSRDCQTLCFGNVSLFIFLGSEISEMVYCIFIKSLQDY